VYLAEDDVKTPEGIIVPGIGGEVYARLGFGSQDDKNRFTPDLVKQRRREILQHESIRNTSSEKDLYVIKHPDGWAVKKPYTESESGIYDAQRQAKIKAKEIVSQLGGEEINSQESNANSQDDKNRSTSELVKQRRRENLQRKSIRNTSSEKERYVIKHPDGWAVKKPYTESESEIYDAQRQAKIKAKEIVSQLGSEEINIQESNGNRHNSDIVSSSKATNT
jgi:protein-tyrosine-phosphatase